MDWQRYGSLNNSGTGKDKEAGPSERGGRERGSCRACEVGVFVSTIVSLIAPIALDFGISVCFSPPILPPFSLHHDYIRDRFLSFVMHEAVYRESKRKLHLTRPLAKVVFRPLI